MIRTPATAVAALSLTLVATLAWPAPAEVDHAAIRDRSLAVLESHFAAFRDATAALADAAVAHCDNGADRAVLENGLRQTWRAWAPLDSYQFGPVEQLGVALTVDFWPDKKDFVGRGLGALLASPPEALREPATVAGASAAAQGLPALERLLYSDLPPCPAAIGIAGNLDTVAETLYDAWFAADGWAALMQAAGPENPVYLDDTEVSRTLFTAADFGLTRVADYRLGHPLGTFERSFPRKAEAWRSGLTAEIIDAQLAGVAELIEAGFGPALPKEEAQRFARLAALTRERLAAVGAPVDVAVADQMGHLRLESVQTRVNQLRLILSESFAPLLGVEVGFSAADGD